jgi:LPS-assembly protein
MNKRLVFSTSSQFFRVSPIFLGLLLWMMHVRVSAVDFLNDDSAPNSPVKLEAQQIKGRPDRTITLEKDAKVDKGNSHIEADDIHYDIVDDKIKALGHVFIDRAGDKFTGNQLQLKMDTGIGYMDSPVYRLLRKNAQGRAERVEFDSQDSATVLGGDFTTCEGPNPDWYLKSSKLSLDNDSGTGVARNAILVFKGVPIAGTPYISFPLAEERVSGFLAPTFITSTTGGLEVTTPYYIDIAPNRDLTLYPHYISRRGLMLGSEARYLDRDYAGQTRAEYLNSDAVTGENRYIVSSQHRQNFGSGLTFNSNLNAASDDGYPNDFPYSLGYSNPATSRRLMLRDAMVNYSDIDQRAMFRVTDFQILQDPRAPIAIPYARLPQLTYQKFNYFDNGLSLELNSDFTRFSHATGFQGATQVVKNADRMVLNPRMTYRWQRPGAFIKPSLSLHMTNYNLDQIPYATMTAPARAVPTASLDSGLIFERDASFFGRDATQTLEPRLFITHTPYVKQDLSLYPNFDSAEADFNYAQIFRENRFVGHDRVGDASTVTTALMSRYLEIEGQERLRVAVAQRFSFADPRVILGNPLSQTSTIADTKSDILMLSSGRVTRELRLDANFQYSQSNQIFNRINFGTFWQPEPMKVLNVQYRRDIRSTDPAANFEIFDISGQWPLSARWYGVGRLNYLIKEQDIGQSLIGAEYRADCWIFRFVGQRTPTAQGIVNTRLFLQLEFNGLSSLGSNPLTALRANVPGYQKLTQPD